MIEGRAGSPHALTLSYDSPDLLRQEKQGGVVSTLWNSFVTQIPHYVALLLALWPISLILALRWTGPDQGRAGACSGGDGGRGAWVEGAGAEVGQSGTMASGSKKKNSLSGITGALLRACVRVFPLMKRVKSEEEDRCKMRSLSSIS